MKENFDNMVELMMLSTGRRYSSRFLETKQEEAIQWAVKEIARLREKVTAMEGIARLRNKAAAVKLHAGVTFEEFSKVNRTRSESPEGFGHKIEDWSLSDWFTAVVGELGEAANIAKKLNRVRDGVPGNDKTEDELRKNLRSEIADVFIYLDLLAQSQGISLVDAVVETFDAKSQKIGYPARLKP